MCSIISLICRAVARWALIAAPLLLSASVARAHSDMSTLEIKGPWSTTCPSMDYSAFFKNDVTMQRAVALAWSMSHEGTADEHEVGFIAYQERRKLNNVYKYRTVIKNAKAGPPGGGTVGTPAPIRTRDLRAVMNFHTHPGPASDTAHVNDYPSDADFDKALRRAVPAGIAWGSGSTWNKNDYLIFGGTYMDTSSNRVTSATPNAKEIEIGTETYWILNITTSDPDEWGWSCPGANVTGSASSWLGAGASSGDRFTQRIRVGPEGQETAETPPPHPAVPSSGARREESVASQLPEMAGLEQILSMAGQSVAPEQLEKMEKAIKGFTASPEWGLLAMGWEDSELVEFMPLGDKPVVFSASLEKTWPSFTSGGQDKVTGMSSVKTTVTSLPQTETGFAFVTVQEMRANAMGKISSKLPTTRSKATAGASAVFNVTMKFEYSRASRLDLSRSLSQQARLSSPDPPMVKTPLTPGVELYWETTAIVTDQNGRMVDLLRFPRLTSPVNSKVADTQSLPLPLPPEGQVYTVTLDVSQQGGNYMVGGPGTVVGGWTAATVTIQGRVSATLINDPKAEPALEPERAPDRPVS